MTKSESRQRIAHDPEALDDAETMLALYPDLDEAERQRLAQFLRRGAPIDIGLLSSNPALWAKADRFKAEQRHYFKVGRGTYAAWSAAVIAIAGTLVLIKDAGANLG